MNTIVHALDQCDPIMALQLIEEGRSTLADSSLMVNYDLYELEAILIQGNSALVQEKLDDFHTKSYSNILSGPLQNKLLEIQAGIALMKRNFEEAKRHFDQLLELAHKEHDTYSTALYGLKKDFCDISLGIVDGGQYVESLDNPAERFNDTYLIGEYYLNVATAYSHQNKQDSTLSFLSKAEDFFEQANQIPRLIEIKHWMGIIHNNNGEFSKTFFDYKDGVELAKRTGAEFNLIQFHLGLGQLSTYFKDYNQARTYLLEARNNNLRLESPGDDYDILSLLGYIEMTEQNYALALRYYSSALDLLDEYPPYEANKYLILYEIGKCYYYLDQFEHASNYFQNSGDLIGDPPNDLRMFHHVNTWKGLIASGASPNTESVLGCQRALEYGLSANIQTLKIEACECLYKSYLAENDIATAFKYMEMHFQLDKDAYEKVSVQHSGYLENAYEDNQKILEFKLSINQQLAETVKKESRLKISRIISAGIAMVSIAIFFFLVSQNKKEQEVNSIIKKKNERLSQLNKEMQDGYDLLEVRHGRLDAQLKNNMLILTGFHNLLDKLTESIDQLNIKRSTKKDMLALVEDRKHLADMRNVEKIFLAHNDTFIKVLSDRFPKLSQVSIKLCILVKLGMSNLEISNFSQVSVDSVKTAKSRLKKKLDVPVDMTLFAFLNLLSNKSKQQASDSLPPS